MSDFDHLGKALRWLRRRRGLRQNQVAEAASITKAMISYYENGRQSPTLDSLDRILKALEVSLADLEEVMRFVGGAEEEPISRRIGPKGAKAGGRTGPGELNLEIYRFLGIQEPLRIEEEEAMRAALSGFQQLVREMHHRSHDTPKTLRDPRTNGEK